MLIEILMQAAYYKPWPAQHSQEKLSMSWWNVSSNGSHSGYRPGTSFPDHWWYFLRGLHVVPPAERLSGLILDLADST